MPEIHRANHPADLRRCYPVMAQLRPHLSEADFLDAVQQQREAGYEIAFSCEGETVSAVAGFRRFSTLAWGRILYVDDLVSAVEFRGCGHASVLVDWLIGEARKSGCAQFHLDSGVQRFGAHRFYLHKGMDITSHHFAMTL